MFLTHQTNTMLSFELSTLIPTYTRNSCVKNMTTFNLIEYGSIERIWNRCWLLVNILHIHGILLKEDKIFINGVKNTTIIILLTECDKPRKN